MKLIIEINPAGLSGYDIRQALATVSAKEYDDILNGGEPLDLRIVDYSCPPPQNSEWCGTIRMEED